MNAAFCCTWLGIVPTVRHADYLGSWLEVLREDNRAIVRAASQASSGVMRFWSRPRPFEETGLRRDLDLGPDET
jgi:antirestriction protein ArdC